MANFGMVRYRPNVAALVVNPAGSLLICERANIPGAWQFPQGGVDPGETPEQALFREVREEVGLEPQHYEVIDRREGYRYLYPQEVRGKKLRKHGSHGQEQTYFLCHLKAGAPQVNVNQKAAGIPGLPMDPAGGVRSRLAAGFQTRRVSGSHVGFFPDPTLINCFVSPPDHGRGR